MFRFLLALLACGYAIGGAAQLTAPRTDTPAAAAAATITADDLRAHLSIIAGDAMEGRETGTEGQRKAAAYIAAQFAELGLPAFLDGGYEQRIAYISEGWDKIELFVGKERFRHAWDYYSFPSVNSDLGTIETEEVLFLGYGIDDPAYNDYAGEAVAGKVLLVYGGEPTDAAGKSYVSGTATPSAWATDWRKKLEAAYRAGAKAVFIIDPDIKKSIADNRRELLSPRMRIGEGEQPETKYANSVFISSTVAKAMLGKRFKKVVKARKKITKKGRPRRVELNKRIQLTQKKAVNTLIGSNVLGYLEGSDPALKDEVIVVSAHYDHLGKKGESIYNGADDNGSGSSTVLEIAEAFVRAKEAGQGPRRSILFLLVSGEEKGLLGSAYYAENPVFPLEKTIADVNVDMVGRVDEAHADNPYYIYVIGSNRLSTELHEINETANTDYAQLDLDYTYNAEDDPNRYYYRSDHYNFAERGIPSIFYFSGVHADYHQPTDTVDKINFEKMVRIGQLVFHTTWELANRDKTIEVDVTTP